jgi:hypothetical protein
MIFSFNRNTTLNIGWQLYFCVNFRCEAPGRFLRCRAALAEIHSLELVIYPDGTFGAVAALSRDFACAFAPCAIQAFRPPAYIAWATFAVAILHANRKIFSSILNLSHLRSLYVK